MHGSFDSRRDRELYYSNPLENGSACMGVPVEVTLGGRLILHSPQSSSCIFYGTPCFITVSYRILDNISLQLRSRSKLSNVKINSDAYMQDVWSHGNNRLSVQLYHINLTYIKNGFK